MTEPINDEQLCDRCGKDPVVKHSIINTSSKFKAKETTSRAWALTLTELGEPKEGKIFGEVVTLDRYCVPCYRDMMRYLAKVSK